MPNLANNLGGGVAIGTAIVGLTPGYILYGGAGGVLAQSAGLTWGTAAGQGLLCAAGTATTDVNALSTTQTWNNAGVTFTAKKTNVTSTASAALSLLEDWQVGGVSKASINKAGTVLGAAFGVGGAPTVGFDNQLSSNANVVGVRALNSNAGSAAAVRLRAENSSGDTADLICYSQAFGLGLGGLAVMVGGGSLCLLGSSAAPSGGATSIQFRPSGYNADEEAARISSAGVLIGATAAGTGAKNLLALSNNSTAPSTSADLVQMHAVDLSAGSATLGLWTETAVAVEVVVSDATLSIKINGTTYKLLLKT